jgi:hypothetical protein
MTSDYNWDRNIVYRIREISTGFFWGKKTIGYRSHHKPLPMGAGKCYFRLADAKRALAHFKNKIEFEIVEYELVEKGIINYYD